MVVRVLFVCMGNICRSPTAAGVFRALVEREGLADRIVVDSAGTHGYHEGEGADRRARVTAAKRGIDLNGHVARSVRREDFDFFDLILAMDRENFLELVGRAPAAARPRIRLFMEFARPEHPGSDPAVEEVPDPYYGGPSGFDRVLDLIEAASAGLLEEVGRLLGGRTGAR
jgi:protein-tyrosine phosphatase